MSSLTAIRIIIEGRILTSISRVAPERSRPRPALHVHPPWIGARISQARPALVFPVRLPVSHRSIELPQPHSPIRACSFNSGPTMNRDRFVVGVEPTTFPFGGDALTSELNDRTTDFQLLISGLGTL